MARQTYTAVMALIKAKLEAIVDGNDETILKAVYDYNIGTPSGYPIAVIQDRAGEGSMIDTHRNERMFEFDIVLYQEIGEKTQDEAATLMRTAVDAVLEAFDEDRNLSENVARVQVVPVSFDYTTQNGPHAFATFNIRVVDVVDNYSS